MHHFMGYKTAFVLCLDSLSFFTQVYHELTKQMATAQELAGDNADCACALTNVFLYRG
jgi:hypothetical protein